MEILFILFSAIIILVIFFIRGMIDEKRKERKIRQEIHNGFGRLMDKKVTDDEWKSIPGYFNAHKKIMQDLGKFMIDDITWNDLNMDAVFSRLNHTYSSSGQEYLYHILHFPVREDEVADNAEKRIQWFAENVVKREELQYRYYCLGRSGKYSIHEYLSYLENYSKRNNTVTLLVDLMLIAAAILLPVHTSLAVTAMFVLITVQMFAYAKRKQEVEPYLVICSYVKRILEFIKEIKGIKTEVLQEECEELEEYGKQFGKFRFGAVLGMRGSSMAGDPLSLIMDYVNTLFHLDIMAIRFMLDEINRHLTELDRIIELVGRTEAEIAIASFRASLKEGWCIPENSGKNEVIVEDIYHPLLEEPVKNSIHTNKSVLITGSNASGKSTFLKTVAVNAILAQTIHTCLAKQYKAPVFRIFSSMALRDDLENGESYYMAEIRSLKRIMDHIGVRDEQNQPILCFVDEVLRGTNTLERIAASVQILKELNSENVICFAATHDIELTELLKKQYNNYHFEESVDDNDIRFDYRLREGKATTRNAIRLLGLIGYDEDIIRRANDMAADYLVTGVWKEVEE